jgi:hypothetical protein
MRDPILKERLGCRRQFDPPRFEPLHELNRETVVAVLAVPPIRFAIE